MMAALLVIMGLVLLLGLLLGNVAFRFKAKGESLVARIDAVLPQTQCGQCGYPGCKPYAAAIASGEADINQCPPGGDAGIRALAHLLRVEYKPLNTKHGVPKPKAVAVIDENVCIGCTLCIQACPVDAILGAAKHMHTVIGDECTGCELCIAPCPVDCISMEPVAPPDWKWHSPASCYRYARSRAAVRSSATKAANVARERHEFRLMRIEREKQERTQRHAQKTASAAAAINKDIAKKAAIAAAIERARAQKAAILPANTDNLSPAVQSEIPEIDARRNSAAMVREKKIPAKDTPNSVAAMAAKEKD